MAYDPSITTPFDSPVTRAAAAGVPMPTDRKEKQTKREAVDLDHRKKVLDEIALEEGMKFIKPIEEIRRDKVHTAGILAIIEKHRDAGIDFEEIQRKIEEEGMTAEEAGFKLGIEDLAMALDTVQKYFILPGAESNYDYFINDPKVKWAVQSKRAYSIALAVVTALSY